MRLSQKTASRQKIEFKGETVFFISSQSRMLPQESACDYDQFVSEVTFYAYVNSNPVNANDPSGMDAHVTVNGNVVNIQIPISYSGKAATPARISELNSAINNQWSGNFGKYQVTTTVTDGHWYDLANNSVKLVRGNGTSYVQGSNTGVWYQSGQGNPAWEATHESGHLMGLLDQYQDTRVGGQRVTVPNQGMEGNVMGAYGKTGVNEGDISNIINANTSWFTKAWNTVKDTFSPSASINSLFNNSGAAGGYLLYPNKPNNNNMGSVYAK